MWTIFASKENVAMYRVMVIVHLAITIPVRWLAAETHNLGHHRWLPRSMGRVVDVLEAACAKIVDGNVDILDEKFMMNLFSVFRLEMVEFDEFLTFKFEKQKRKDAGKSSEKMLLFAKLQDELFHPKLDTNKETDKYARQFGVVFMKAMLQELQDPLKVTSKYLSSLDGKLLHENTSLAEHEALFGKKAVNDDAERTHGAGSRQIQTYTCVNLGKGFGVGHAKIQGDFSREKDGFLYCICDDDDLAERLRVSLLVTAMEEAPSVVEANNAEILKQQEAKHHHMELARAAALEKATDAQIDILCYYKMYSQPVCLRMAKAFDTAMKKISAKGKKLDTIKENISIRVIGFKWEDLHHPWSKNGVQYSSDELAKHLKMIIKEEQR